MIALRSIGLIKPSERLNEAVITGPTLVKAFAIRVNTFYGVAQHTFIISTFALHNVNVIHVCSYSRHYCQAHVYHTSLIQRKAIQKCSKEFEKEAEEGYNYNTLHVHYKLHT